MSTVSASISKSVSKFIQSSAIPTFQHIRQWAHLYIVSPTRQILNFLAISILITVVLALLIGVIFNVNPDGTYWHNIDLFKLRPGINLLQQVLIQLPSTIIDGVTIGFVYAIIALGYTMVYGVLKFVNFAHSEVFMVGGVIGYEVMQLFASNNQLQTINPLLLILIMLLAAMLFCGLLAVVIEQVAYKPLRNAPRLVPLISAIGVSFFLQDLVRAIQAMRRNEFNMAYPTSGVPLFNTRFLFKAEMSQQGGISPLFNTGLSTNAIIIVISALLMLIALNYFVNGTRLGKAIRAVSQDQPTASLMGINVNWMISLTFFIGGALGGAAGVLFGLKTGRISPYIGFIPGLKAFTAAVLGGIGNITGALLGSILLGLLESFFSSLLPYFPALGTGYSDIFAFAILILILIFKPTGLLGKKSDEKV